MNFLYLSKKVESKYIIKRLLQGVDGGWGVISIWQHFFLFIECYKMKMNEFPNGFVADV